MVVGAAGVALFGSTTSASIWPAYVASGLVAVAFFDARGHRAEFSPCPLHAGAAVLHWGDSDWLPDCLTVSAELRAAALAAAPSWACVRLAQPSLLRSATC